MSLLATLKRCGCAGALLTGVSLIMGSQFAQGVEVDASGKYVWRFLSGLPWPGGYDATTGKPQNMINARNEYAAEFFTRVNNALPEARINSNFLTSDVGANITLREAGDVYVTFIHEGAGYLNSFGFFTFDKNNPPTSKSQIRETIVFPNLSYPHLASGHRIKLGNFPAGTSIGFFLAANGFASATGVKTTASPFYYSLSGLNPESTPTLRQHNVLLVDDATNEVVLGFEDLSRVTGDNDFNDAVFSIKVTPETALDTSTLNLIPAAKDSDSDGITDSQDEFPQDFTRASSSYYPSQQNWTTLAFEDNWPKVGDYDMNDLVVRERFQTIFNAAGLISGFKLSGFIDARGAANHNGFALRIMNMDKNQVKQASISIAGQTRSIVAEGDQRNPVLIFWQDSHSYTDTGVSQGNCSHFNTSRDCPQLPAVAYEVDVQLATPVASLPHSALDFFIFHRDYRGREIHFADYPPTDKFDTTQFGKFDDTSVPGSNRYFRSANNLPWALKIPSQWRYPREYIDVIWAYPEYEIWVESGGVQGTNWFQLNDRINHYY